MHQRTDIILCDDIPHYVTYGFLFTENACEKRLKILNWYSGAVYLKKDRQYNGKKDKEKSTKHYTENYKTLHRKLQIEQHEPH
jgi:hypothetical protein